MYLSLFAQGSSNIQFAFSPDILRSQRDERCQLSDFTLCQTLKKIVMKKITSCNRIYSSFDIAWLRRKYEKGPKGRFLESRGNG